MPSPSESNSDPPRTARAWWREHLVLAAAAGAVVAVIVIRALLPAAIQRALPWAARHWGGARLEVEDVDLGLLRGSLSVEGMRVARLLATDPQPRIDPATALLRFDRLHFQLRWSELLSRRVHLDILEIDGPTGRLQQRADGSFDLPQPPPSPAETPPQPEPRAPEGSGWELVLDRVALRDLDFELYDVGVDEAVLDLAFRELTLVGLAFGGEASGLSAVTLRRPELHVSRDWLLAPSPPATAAGEPPPPRSRPPEEEGQGFAIQHVGIESAGFSVRTPRGPVEAELRLEARDVSRAPGHVFPLEIELILGEGRVGVEGRLGANPVSFEGGIEWNGLRVPPLLAALRPRLLPWIQSCESSGRIDLSVRSRAAPDAEAGIKLAGSFQIDDFTLADPESEDLSVTWQRSEIELREVRLPLGDTAAPRLDFERVALESPRVVFAGPSTALARLEAATGPAAVQTVDSDTDGAEPRPDSAADGEPRTESGSPVAVRIDELTLGGGSVQLSDRSVTPLYETRLDDVKVAVRGLAWPERNVEQLRFDARVQHTASVSLRGAFASGDGRVDIDLSDLELVPYDGFAQRAGWRIAAGRGSLDTALRLQGDGFTADNALLLHDLDVDSDDPNAFVEQVGVPVDVALALLRDPKGDIALEIPVTARAGQIGVGFAKIVRNAVLAAIKGALTSPLKLLGAVIPNGAVQVASFDLVAFAPGSSEVDAEVRGRAKPIARLLAERPKLALALAGRAAPEDTPPLAEQALREGAAAGEDLPDVGAGGFLARRRVESALRQRAEGEAGELAPEDEALLARAVAAQSVSEERRRELAKARAEALRDALVGAGAPPEALLLEVPGEADVPGVALELRTRGEPE